MLKKGCLKLDTALNTWTKSAQIKSRQHQNTASKHQTPSRPKQASVTSHHPTLTSLPDIRPRPDTLLVKPISTQPYFKVSSTTGENLSNNDFDRLPLCLLQPLIYNYIQNRNAIRLKTPKPSTNSPITTMRPFPGQCFTYRVCVLTIKGDPPQLDPKPYMGCTIFSGQKCPEAK
jgi:hypothetical protein